MQTRYNIIIRPIEISHPLNRNVQNNWYHQTADCDIYYGPECTRVVGSQRSMVQIKPLRNRGKPDKTWAKPEVSKNRPIDRLTNLKVIAWHRCEDVNSQGKQFCNREWYFGQGRIGKWYWRVSTDSTYRATCNNEKERGNSFFKQVILELFVHPKSLWTVGSCGRWSTMEDQQIVWNFEVNINCWIEEWNGQRRSVNGERSGKVMDQECGPNNLRTQMYNFWDLAKWFGCVFSV